MQQSDHRRDPSQHQPKRSEQSLKHVNRLITSELISFCTELYHSPIARQTRIVFHNPGASRSTYGQTL